MAAGPQMLMESRKFSPSAPLVGVQVMAAIAKCQSRYRLRPSGSWATQEAHLPHPVNGIVHSFSDIDLITETELPPFQQRRIRHMLEYSAQSAGIRLTGVSIRPEHNFSSLPHACGWSRAALRRTMSCDRRAFLGFWTAIAAIEATITAVRQRDCPAREVASYVAAKFFFTLVRNVALVNGVVLVSYQDLCNWVCERTRDIPIFELYRIKTGKLLTLPEPLLDSTLGDGVLSALLGPVEPAATIARDVLAYSRGTAALRPLRYAAIAEDLAPDEAARKVARWEATKVNLVMPMSEHSNAV
jgi:hypothetical protein